MPSNSLSPQSCGSSVIEFHWPSKSNSLGLLSPFARSPGWEICCEPFATVGELLWYNFSAVCGSPAGGSMVGLMETSSKRTYTTCYIFQDSCCQSPCPRSCLLLTHASTGNPQTVTGRSGSVLVEVTASFPGFAQGLICALQASLVGMRFEFTAFQIGSSVPSF